MSWCCCCCLRRGVGRIGALERRIFLLVLGLDGAGKTCVAKAIVDGNSKDLGDVAPTVGFSKMETRLVN